MKCPYFAGEYMQYCTAEKDVYIPSISEIRDQCRLPQHKVCWHYMRTDHTKAATKDPRTGLHDARNRATQ